MLRKSPTRTEAFLAANRRNALRSTGPRTARGKARSSMNALKHGRYAKRLPQKLTEAGDHGGAALYQKVRQEVVTAFPGASSALETRQLDQYTAKVWLLARRAGVNGRKPGRGRFSKKSKPLRSCPLLFRVVDERRRIGIVYWVQRKRFWTLPRKLEALAGIYPVNVPTLGEALQDKLRHQIYRMGRPGLWEQQRLWADAQVNGLPWAGPDGARPGETGKRGDAARTSIAETARTNVEKAAPHPAIPGNFGPTKAGGLRWILARFLARFLGGGRE